MLFRCIRGNLITHSLPINQTKDAFVEEYYKNRTKNEKTIVYLLFPRTNQNVIEDKINKILNLFEANRIEIPERVNQQELMLSIRTEMEENRKILSETRVEINQILESFSKPQIVRRLSFLKILSLVIEREKIFA